MKTTFNQAQKTAIAVAALNRARKLNPERAAQELADANAGSEENGDRADLAVESEPNKKKEATPPKGAPSLCPPSLTLCDAEVAALQQRKLALNDYARKAFAADKRTDTDPR